MAMNESVALEVWGSLACFTRPEMKVERFSYPVITPSAARGILDAIYCKPIEFGWRIDRIEILEPIRYLALRRNEVKEKISVSAVKRAMRSGTKFDPIVADAAAAGNDQVGRTQRQTMALTDVRYRVYGHIHPRPTFEHKLKAFVDQARRRIDGGKCFYQPYFGCREFPAFFSPIDSNSPRQTQPIDLDVGYMLYDVFDLRDAKSDRTTEAKVSLFYARIAEGVLQVPPYESSAVRRVG